MLPEENVFGHSKKLRLIRESLARLREELGRPLEILDVGCGNGSAVTRFLPQAGDRVLGVDEHAESIEYACRHFASGALDFRHQGAEGVFSEGRLYDAIVFADVLEHLRHPQKLLDRGSKRLGPRGAILVTVPNGWGPFEIESWLSRVPLVGSTSLWLVDHFVAVLNRFVLTGAWTRVVVDPDEVPYNLDSGHVQFFTRRRLLALARQSGFELRRFCNLSWLSGPFTNSLFAPSRRFCDWNTRVADRLPPAAVSAWFLELRKPENVA
ncbi:MAG: class I SAM-dependent methyltransferase [Thermoanaerobaculia bacterium]